ncbi:hypothetical protein NDU88_002378 [Pleurodeles waltl]|uniref:Uncharacterized protein n=1 Tax=Pleurodeles waltl TaxID=8319 RepID=A0AAV7T248_PLEWA|nr:hypothetical protein NDU88_002378 [Pleurodeles waltl]
MPTALLLKGINVVTHERFQYPCSEKTSRQPPVSPAEGDLCRSRSQLQTAKAAKDLLSVKLRCTRHPLSRASVSSKEPLHCHLVWRYRDHCRLVWRYRDHCRLSSGGTEIIVASSGGTEIIVALPGGTEIIVASSGGTEIIVASHLEVQRSLSPRLEVQRSLSPRLEVQRSLLPRLEVQRSLSPRLEVQRSLSPLVWRALTELQCWCLERNQPFAGLILGHGKFTIGCKRALGLNRSIILKKTLDFVLIKLRTMGRERGRQASTLRAVRSDAPLVGEPPACKRPLKPFP